MIKKTLIIPTWSSNELALVAEKSQVVRLIQRFKKKKEKKSRTIHPSIKIALTVGQSDDQEKKLLLSSPHGVLMNWRLCEV